MIHCIRGGKPDYKCMYKMKGCQSSCAGHLVIGSSQEAFYTQRLLTGCTVVNDEAEVGGHLVILYTLGEAVDDKVAVEDTW